MLFLAFGCGKHPASQHSVKIERCFISTEAMAQDVMLPLLKYASDDFATDSICHSIELIGDSIYVLTAKSCTSDEAQLSGGCRIEMKKCTGQILSVVLHS